MSWFTKTIGLDRLTNRGVVPKLDREQTLWLVLKLLKPNQRAALRMDIQTAIEALENPKLVNEARLFLLDMQSAVNR